MEERLEKIESKLSLAEDLLDALNQTVYRQQQALEQLRKEVVVLREQVRMAMPDEPRTAQDDVPPHY